MVQTPMCPNRQSTLERNAKPFTLQTLLVCILVGSLFTIFSMECRSTAVFPTDSPWKMNQFVRVTQNLIPVYEKPDPATQIKTRFFEDMILQLKGISEQKSIVDGKTHYWYRVLASDGRDTWWVFGAYLEVSDKKILPSTQEFFAIQEIWANEFYSKAKALEENNKLEEALQAYTEARIIYRYHFDAELGMMRVTEKMKQR